MKDETPAQIKARLARIHEESRQIWESYKERMKEHKVVSEKLWFGTKFIRPEEKLEAYKEWVNEKDYFSDLHDPLNEGLECYREYAVSFPDSSLKEKEVKRFEVMFESKSTTAKDVRIASGDFGQYSLPNDRKDRKPEL